MKYSIYIVFSVVMVMLMACDQATQQRFEAKPVALGKINEIVLVTGDQLEDSMVRDTFDYYFGSSYPITPTPEPMFDIRHFTVAELEAEPLRKQLRTYVLLADLSDEHSLATRMLEQDLGAERLREAREGLLTSSVGRDKWAKNQIIIYLFASGQKALAQLIKEKYSAVASRVTKHDEEQLKASIYAIRSSNPGLSRKIADNIGVRVEVPGDFAVAVEDYDADFVWLRKDAKDAIINLTFSSYPYTGPEMLTQKGISDLRNNYGKTYVEGSSAGSYMVTNSEDLPMYIDQMTIDDHYAVEARGIWELTEDFAGGPYISTAIVNEETQRLLLVDGFVLAPGKEKRKYLQQLAFIMKNAKIPAPQND